MNRVGKAFVAGALCCCPAIATAADAATYIFSGHGSPSNSGAGHILNYIDRHAPMTFEFTTADPLAANMAFTSIKTLATSWTASGGSAESTISSTDGDLDLEYLTVSTDASGNILKYNISVYATNALLPNNRWHFAYGNGDAANVFEIGELYTWHVNPVLRYTTLDSALNCTNACGGSATLGRFRLEADAPPAVPEPATWAMMVAGFGLLGASLRRPDRRYVVASSRR